MRLTRVARIAATAVRRGGAGHGHGHGHSSSEYGGFHAPHVEPIFQKLSTGIGAVMWFWILYRAREDGPVLLGLRHPWDHGDHGHEEGEEGGEHH